MNRHAHHFPLKDGESNDTPGSIRKTILILSDEDLKVMLQFKQKGISPTQHIQKIYRNFITQLQ